MNAQLQALLALQADDDAVQGLEQRIAALAPRLARLDAERQAADRALASARAAVDREEERHAHLRERAQDFKRLHERAMTAAEHVSKAHHATAATAQLDISRRALSDAETELTGSAGRVATLRATLDAAEARLAGLDAQQAAEREALRAERDAIAGELEQARAQRAGTARGVDPRLLTRYERVRGRRHGTAVFALRDFTCRSCDTKVATQRRAALAAGTIDVCESCGVLIYAPDGEG